MKSFFSLLTLAVSTLALGACQSSPSPATAGADTTRPHHVHADGSIHYE